MKETSRGLRDPKGTVRDISAEELARQKVRGRVWQVEEQSGGRSEDRAWQVGGIIRRWMWLGCSLGHGEWQEMILQRKQGCDQGPLQALLEALDF